ncbi:MAG: hypothetical protein ACRYFZ_09685 [Janthinobacterium lividum]
MSDAEAARYALDQAKYGLLPEPVRFRKGPVGEDGKPLDPERKIIAVYPDGTFPIKDGPER